MGKRLESGEHEVRFKRENTGVGGMCGGTVGFREYYVSLVETKFGNHKASTTPRRAWLGQGAADLKGLRHSADPLKLMAQDVWGHPGPILGLS